MDGPHRARASKQPRGLIRDAEARAAGNVHACHTRTGAWAGEGTRDQCRINNCSELGAYGVDRPSLAQVLLRVPFMPFG